MDKPSATAAAGDAQQKGMPKMTQIDQETEEARENQRHTLTLSAQQDVYERALHVMTDEGDKEGVSAAALREMLAGLPTDEAVARALQAVLCNWCRDYTAAYQAVSTLFERPLTLWQSNTVHQLLCMLDLRGKRFERVIAYIKELGPERFTAHTPKAMELLRLLESACRAKGDAAGAQTALELQVKLAHENGQDSALNRSVLARYARMQGKPWEDLNPELATFLQQAQREQEMNVEQMRTRLSAMDEKTLAETRQRFQAMMSSPTIPDHEKKAVSNELCDLLYRDRNLR